ncbi:hypothetical protein [Cuneatibacter caecimuris]|uniref:L-fucose isomerase-like protein n=1 Tax=Cuneatibacter caecimuris TaxID=1796618 RepID=A0A4Q7PPF2_9FIRM|nr:hypothetical protein [Cuneatibacter caecimuris]RZT01918.1 L-fucose isomerase-like protein [Cuneatibacter caecimuris]
MRHAMDVRVNLKPVFSNMVHTDIWEGPCRTGTVEELDPRYERRTGLEQFEIWCEELKKHISPEVNILEPVYLEYDESFTVPESEFEKLEKDVYQTDLFLITYRVPGIERFGKAVSMLDLGPTPIDLVGFYKNIGLEAYMAHDYREYNKLLHYLRVKKALANTKMLILSATEQIPASVNTSCPDLLGLAGRYGIRNSRLTFRAVFDVMDQMDVTEEMEARAESLLDQAQDSSIRKEWICQDLKYYYAVRRLMEKYGCNAFTTSCKELCASRLPMKNKCTPCLAHSLNKDDRIPSACEEDVNVLIATMILMYLTGKSTFMGNPVLVPKGQGNASWLKLSGYGAPAVEFDRDVLEIHHSVPGLRMDGFQEEPMKYLLGHFTAEGWGTKIQVDMWDHEEKTVTFARFNRDGDALIAARGKVLGCDFRERGCSPAVYYDVEGGVREFRQALANGCFGHHLAVVYGDYTKELKELGAVVGFRTEIFQ